MVKMTSRENKLSLLAAFDDLDRHSHVLMEGFEEDFLAFSRNQEECRKKWLAAEMELSELRLRLSMIESEKATLETRWRHTKEELDHEIKKRMKAEHEKETLEHQVDLIRELLINDKKNSSALNDEDREKLAFLSSAVSNKQKRRSKRLSSMDETHSFSLPDGYYDNSQENVLDVSTFRSGKVWKRKKTPTAPEWTEKEPERERKRSRTSLEEEQDQANTSITTKTVITIPANGGPMSASSEICTENNGGNNCIERCFAKHNNTNNSNATQTVKGILKDNNLRIPLSPTLTRSPSSASRLTRMHDFVTKKIIGLESCSACGRRMRFGVKGLRCKEWDCRVLCHVECKDRAPLPCTPNLPQTPRGHSQKQAKKREPQPLSFYTTSERPMIPAIVIHCVNEIETRGLKPGLYRISGAKKEIKELRDKFEKGKGMPNLAAVEDINSVCGCLKSFLKDLREPLVTYDNWHSFTNAAEAQDPEEAIYMVYQAISQLPEPNRDTLAFLILHLLRVAECKDCMMPADNLAKVFGPTIVGYSIPEPEPMQMITETKLQVRVMELLLSVPSDYWMRYINVDDDDEDMPMQYNHDTPQTPEARPVPSSMLGSVTTPGSYASYRQRERGERRQFFSPMV